MLMKRVEMFVQGLTADLQQLAAEPDQAYAEKALLKRLRLQVRQFRPRDLYLAQCRETVQTVRQQGYYIRYLRGPRTPDGNLGAIRGAVVYRLQGDIVQLGASYCHPKERRRLTRHEAVHRAFHAQQGIDRGSWQQIGKRVLLEQRIPYSMRTLVDTVLTEVWAYVDREAQRTEQRKLAPV